MTGLILKDKQEHIKVSIQIDTFDLKIRTQTYNIKVSVQSDKFDLKNAYPNTKKLMHKLTRLILKTYGYIVYT